MQSEALPSSRYGTRSSKMMLLLFLLASAAVGRVTAFSDEELFVIEKRLQWQTQEAQIKRDLPKCRKNEQLCPISRGSNDLHCVDLVSAKTCGGCPAEDEAIDCTVVPNVFMHGCTSRGQCTGCRWRIGGMNQSLEHPDYLQCSIIRTAPLRRQRKPSWRMPVLSYARILEKLPSRAKPMAARLRPHGYAAEDSETRPIVPKKPVNRVMVPPKAGSHLIDEPIDKTKQLSPAVLKTMQAARKAFAKPLASTLDASKLPQPPSWLTTYLSNNLGRLSLSADDESILEWLKGLESAIVKTVTVPKIETEADRRRKKSNAERFRLNLPPIVPADLKQKNKRKPTRAFADDYTDEELEALGWDDLKPVRNEPDMGSALIDGPSGSAIVWIQILRECITFKGKTKSMRADVMEAVWLLLDHSTRASGTQGKSAIVDVSTADRRPMQLMDQIVGVDVGVEQDFRQAGRPILPKFDTVKQIEAARKLPQALRPPGAKPIVPKELVYNDGTLVDVVDSEGHELEQTYLTGGQHLHRESAEAGGDSRDDIGTYDNGKAAAPPAVRQAAHGPPGVFRPKALVAPVQQAGLARHKPGNNAHGRPIVPKAATYHDKQQVVIEVEPMESPRVDEASHVFIPKFAVPHHKQQPVVKKPPQRVQTSEDLDEERSSELSVLRDMLAKQAQQLQHLQQLMLKQAPNQDKTAAEQEETLKLPPSSDESRDDSAPFEEHLQQMNIAKIRHLAQQVQPEISLLEKEGLLDAVRQIDAHTDSQAKVIRPMMAGMAKARPNAHKLPVVVGHKGDA